MLSFLTPYVLSCRQRQVVLYLVTLCFIVRTLAIVLSMKMYCQYDPYTINIFNSIVNSIDSVWGVGDRITQR